MAASSPAGPDPVQELLDRITDLVESARAMPMSASCVVNRAELLGLLDELRRSLPEAFDHARSVLDDRESVVQEGRREAARIIADARAERVRLVQAEEVHVEAVLEADRVLADARESAESMRREVEDYVDAKLANFEIVLSKTLAAVERGRQKLSGRHELEALGDRPEGAEPDPDEAPLPG